jgi:hypothetical protein
MIDLQLSTGLPGLDRVLRGLIPGDNIVWQVDSVEDYAPFVRAFAELARARGRRLVYFRFCDHEPLLSEAMGADVRELRASGGFEQFITAIHRAVSEAGRGACLVFDCLSSLAVDWNSDRMLGNFFMLTCPYILDIESVAFFGLLRGFHSTHAMTPITRTTQIFLEVYRHEQGLYVQPTKVQQRYSPTMYMLHAWQGDDFQPVMESATTAEILTSRPWSRTESASFRLGVWNRRFIEAEDVWRAIQEGRQPAEDGLPHLRTLLRMAVSRDERVLQLAERYLTLGDVLAVRRRMIGTGLVGGKSVGMLLARAILARADPRWAGLLEPHDSFFIGSDVFYTYLVQNGCWWLRQKQQDPATFLEGVEEARRRILTGRFSESISRDFAEMLDYFGQSPIIVRSSSLLEDSFGNAFAGKYESVFCANQGPHQKRLDDFLTAVRTIYASTMSEKALRYRAQRGLLERDEQMSLLVQRVSGTRYGALYYPHVAGVGLSFNPYVWSEYIDPAAGMLRMVFGLGTRAVDRVDDDYTRVVALNAPERRPEADATEVRRYSQRKVDVIDLEANQLVSAEFGEVVRRSADLSVDLFAQPDPQLARWAARQATAPPNPRILTFDALLSDTAFIADMGAMLQTLQQAYEYPVDTEFTANFFSPERYRINLVQCRPLQIRGGGVTAEPPRDLRESDIVLQAHGAVIGRSRVVPIDRFVYVVPSAYGKLPTADRYAVARLIGRLMHAEPRSSTIMLIGPGRWGTTTPALGVPVSFAEIHTVSVLCEVVAMREDLVPDVSLGTHFFNELVELDILYLALFPDRRGNRWDQDFFEHSARNRLEDLLPEAASWAGVLRVIDAADLGEGVSVQLNANTLQQQVVCYLEKPTARS